MKIMIIALSLFAVGAQAHTIQGTQVLEGSLKTKTIARGIEVSCRVSIDKVKNTLEEDSFGNPSYQVKVGVSLDGKDAKKKIEVKHEWKNWLTNMYPEGVRDFDYTSSEGVDMKITSEGRIKSVSLTVGGEKVNCNF